MATLAPIATIEGLCRDTRTLTKMLENGNRQPFGVELSVLSEPSGGFAQVTIFSDDMPIDAALALKGSHVGALVSIDVRKGYLSLTTRNVEVLATA